MRILTIQENGFIKVEEKTAKESCYRGRVALSYAKRIADHNKELDEAKKNEAL